MKVALPSRSLATCKYGGGVDPTGTAAQASAHAVAMTTVDSYVHLGLNPAGGGQYGPCPGPWNAHSYFTMKRGLTLRAGLPTSSAKTGSVWAPASAAKSTRWMARQGPMAAAAVDRSHPANSGGMSTNAGVVDHHHLYRNHNYGTAAAAAAAAGLPAVCASRLRRRGRLLLHPRCSGSPELPGLHARRTDNGPGPGTVRRGRQDADDGRFFRRMRVRDGAGSGWTLPVPPDSIVKKCGRCALQTV
ncbi:hypothetical protein MTO96_027601 [Rhipicephalus appendiculatus]